ncbi:MAG: hypothetical protein ABI671_11825 [Burkholderiales bacterium]
MTPHDEERDAWLAQALRHAPDADADAPPALSNAILREARSAAMPRSAARETPRPDSIGPLQWLALAWDWLARPPVAAGFASVMVATLVGVMWWDRPLDESLPRDPEVIPQTPQARTETPQPAVAGPAPPTPEARPAPRESNPPGSGTATGAVAARARVAEMKAAERKSAGKNEAEKSARASRPTEEPTRRRSAPDAAPAVAAAAPPPVAFPAAPQAAATANEVVSPLERQREPMAPSAKTLAEPPAPAAADRAASPRNDLRALQGPAGPAALAKARVADAGDTPLTTLRARIAQQPERWRWQRGPGSPQAMNAGVQGWLAEVDARAARHWQSGAGGTAPEAVNLLRLFRDGVLQATLGLAGSAVWLEASGTSAAAASLAPLPEDAAHSLRKALVEAAP